MGQLLKNESPFERRILDEFVAVLELGINHEQQHQELLLMDIRRNFYENPLRPRYRPYQSHGIYTAVEPTWHDLASGLIEVGVARGAPEFAFDNERDRHPQWIESYMLSRQLVTNQDFLEFIDSGGYENPLLWSSDGWGLKSQEKWEAPLYWETDQEQWWIFTYGGMEPLDLGVPVVHVSDYRPYPRFEEYRQGLGEYNEKFTVNQLVVRGGSCLTPRAHYRSTYRNDFYPHMRWQLAGIRLAKDLV